MTSQIFANIYLNELDQFVKHGLKVKNYFRYADDFVIISADHDYLEITLEEIRDFLAHKLSLELHPQKVEIRKFRQGIDFLGYVILPHYTVLRTKTKRRMLRKLSANCEAVVSGDLDQEKFQQTIQSYLGILGHCNEHKLEVKIKNEFLNNDLVG